MTGTENCRPRPRPVTPDNIEIATPKESTLDNGVRLYTLDCSEHEVIRVSFVFQAGTSLQCAPFSASSTANLLSEGTDKHTAHQIAELLDFHGSYFNVSLDRDYAVITFVSLLKFFPQTMAVSDQILLHPLFDKDELATYAAKRKQRLAVERSKIAVRARELFAQTLFGPGHPYGICYDQELYNVLTREDLLDFYSRRYTAENCFVVASGKVGQQQTDLIAQTAGRIPVGGDYSQAEIPEARSERFVFREHADAVQSAVRIGKILFPRTHPDYIGVQVASTILGGYFGSRLVQNLREQHGYTYGVFSSVVNLQHAGYLAIATEVGCDVTRDAVNQIFAELDKMRSQTVEESELSMVRNIMTGEVMRILDGPFGIADVTIENIQNGTDTAYLTRFLDEVRNITPERVREIAGKYFDPAGFTTVIMGNCNVGDMF